MGDSLRFKSRVISRLDPDLLAELDTLVPTLAAGPLTGTLFRVLRPLQFFPAAAEDLDSVDPADFAPFTSACRVEVVPTAFLGLSIFPGLSSTVGPDGTFSVATPPAPFDRVQLRFVLPGTNGAPDRLIYRSAPFKAQGVIGKPLRIFVFPLPVPDTVGVGQERINEQVAEALQTDPALADVDHLSATIIDRGLRVTAVRGRATVTLTLVLRPSKAIDLGRFLSHAIEAFDIDLPRLVGCFVNEDKVEEDIRQAMDALVKDINGQIEETFSTFLAEAQGLDPAQIQALLQEEMTLTFTSARFPVIDTETAMGGAAVREIRNIVFEPSFGMPREII